jgi:hypothetical protein
VRPAARRSGLGAVEQGAVVALDHRDRSERLTQRLGYPVARAFRQLRPPVGQLDLGDQPHVPLILVPLDVQDAADRVGFSDCAVEV